MEILGFVDDGMVCQISLTLFTSRSEMLGGKRQDFGETEAAIHPAVTAVCLYQLPHCRWMIVDLRAR
jgi:uncharacterized membrane protein YkvA (DUF1232 family)